jgi:hypothetical protein
MEVLGACPWKWRRLAMQSHAQWIAICQLGQAGASAVQHVAVVSSSVCEK